MRNVKSMTLGLIAMGALLAAAPPAATTRPADAAERTVTIALPGGPAPQPGPNDTSDSEAANTLSQLGNAALKGNTSALYVAALSRLPSSGAGGTSPTLDVGIYTKSLADGRFDVRLTARPAPDSPPGAADRLADAAADVIRDRVLHAWDETVHTYKERLPKAQREVADATAQLAKAREQVAAGEAQIRQRTGRIDLSAAGMQATADALELERQKVELDVAGLKARREGLEMAIAAEAQKAADARKADPAAEALARAVETSKQRLDVLRKMAAAGTATTAEVGAAEVAELEAEAKLAERRNAAGGTADAMAQWTRALTEAAIEQREKEARLAAATKNLAALVEATARQQDLSNARTAEANAAGQLSNAERRLRNVTAWLERYGDARPVVAIRRAAAPTTTPSNE